jgi:Skp family chaperone for outer membrane proteins
MRKQRLAVLGLVFGTSAATMGVWLGGVALAQPAGEAIALPRASEGVRIATVDIFAIAQSMMNREELKQPRDAVDAQFRTRMEAVEREFEQIENRLRNFQSAADPQVQPLLQQRQQKAEEYQRIVQERQQEIERLNASQLALAYASIRDAAKRIGQERGYTHVMSNRAESRAAQSNTVADALQDMLARPLVMTPQEHDLTDQVAAALNVDLSVQPEQPEVQPGAMPGSVPSHTPPGGSR